MNKSADKEAIKRAYRSWQRSIILIQMQAIRTLRRCLRMSRRHTNVLSDEKNVSFMDEFGLLVCRMAFPRRLQDRLHLGGFGGFGGFWRQWLFQWLIQLKWRTILHIRNFHFENGSGIWMIFSQCSEICFRHGGGNPVSGWRYKW